MYHNYPTPHCNCQAGLPNAAEEPVTFVHCADFPASDGEENRQCSYKPGVDSIYTSTSKIYINS